MYTNGKCLHKLYGEKHFVDRFWFNWSRIEMGSKIILYSKIQLLCPYCKQTMNTRKLQATFYFHENTRFKRFQNKTTNKRTSTHNTRHTLQINEFDSIRALIQSVWRKYKNPSIFIVFQFSHVKYSLFSRGFRIFWIGYVADCFAFHLLRARGCPRSE